MSVLYNGLRTLVDPKTGEKVQVQNIIKTAPVQQFRKLQLMDFLMSIGVIGNKSVLVYSYVLGHMGARTNKLHQTNDQIQKGLADEGNKISKHTIMRVLSKLERTKDSNGNYILTRKRYGKYGRHSYLMLDPKLVGYGKDSHANGLLLQYNRMNKKKRNPKKSKLEAKRREASKIKRWIKNRKYTPIYNSKAKAKRYHAGYQQRLFSEQKKTANKR